MRTQGAALSDMLFGQTRGRILATLYDKPETGFYVRQMARFMGGSVGTVQRELATLTNVGLICRTEGENQVFYRANRDHPAFAELRALLAKTTGVFHLLRDALETFTDRIEFAFVYGSFARGEENAASDVDLIVVGEVAFDDLLEHLSPVEQKLNRPVNPTIFAREELRAKVSAGNHFLTAIQSGPLIFLMGNENEFREIR